MAAARHTVRAPASTANLGPGFDCAAAALDLWNEIEVEEGEHAVVVEGEGAAELPHGDEHLALRAFALVAAPERYRFRFVNRIPLERGLGSSAATIAAAARAARMFADSDWCLDMAVRATDFVRRRLQRPIEPLTEPPGNVTDGLVSTGTHLGTHPFHEGFRR